MNDSTPQGSLMTLDTFYKAINFSIRYEKSLIISGGEPLEHPCFFEIVDIIKEYLKKDKVQFCNVFSNGTFLSDPHMVDKVLDTGLEYYITNDYRYYPKSIKKVDSEHFHYDVEVRMLPFGRAYNKYCSDFDTTMCGDFRDRIKNIGSFGEALKKRRNICSPSITPEGAIVMSESNLCAKIGTIEDSEEYLIKSISGNICGKCGL